MQINWLIPLDMPPSLYDIDGACQKFFDTYQVSPDTITISRKHYSMLIMNMPRTLYGLEKGKEYNLFIPVVSGGLVEIVISDELSTTYSNSHDAVPQSVMIVENKKAEAAFEKEVLGK